MTLLRKLFEVAAVGGHETDTFKHLAASFTVLRSLCAAKTATNRESSRVGHFIEVQVSDGALYRTKIHCYFLDQSRVVSPLPMEKNYHIFYQVLLELVSLFCLACNSTLKLFHLDAGGVKSRGTVTTRLGRFHGARPPLLEYGGHPSGIWPF